MKKGREPGGYQGKSLLAVRAAVVKIWRWKSEVFQKQQAKAPVALAQRTRQTITEDKIVGMLGPDHARTSTSLTGLQILV